MLTAGVWGRWAVSVGRLVPEAGGERDGPEPTCELLGEPEPRGQGCVIPTVAAEAREGPRVGSRADRKLEGQVAFGDWGSGGLPGESPGGPGCLLIWAPRSAHMGQAFCSSGVTHGPPPPRTPS